MRFSVTVFMLWGSLAFAAAPTFQDLMDPSVFPKAQRGMIVEKTTCVNGALNVTTTGAEFSLNATGDGVFRQRIGHPRNVLSMRIEGGLGVKPPVIRTSEGGFAFASYETPAMDVRVNGDSLFMFHAHQPVTITVSRMIEVGFYSSYRANHVLFDEYGGFGLYCSEQEMDDAFNPRTPITARYELPANAVLWVGICPPKQYDWARSFKDNVVWHWSNQLGYPADSDFATWSKKSNIALLQSEVMLWKDWNLAFEPRLGEAEFARVRKTSHKQNMKFIVYTSPFYFLRGTPIESQAMNSFENFKEFPPGDGSGVNIDLFMNEITRVMREYKPDGLYFDGQYVDNPAPLYALARRTRELLGNDGILEWHSTYALGSGRCFLPQADAYVDFILRGEGSDSVYGDFGYLRYFVSGYNTSNSIGVLCTNGPRPGADTLDRLLTANVRLHTLASWFADAPFMEILRKHYQAKLGTNLRNAVEQGVEARQQQMGMKTREMAEEEKILSAEPRWKKPVFSETFNAVPNWTQSVSPLSVNPFAAKDGVMSVTARAHTHAYLTRLLDAEIHGFTAKVRQGNDGGQAWGPAVQLRWKNGARLRVGLRSDGVVQSDIDGEQRLHGRFDPSQWVWLRVRWFKSLGIIEQSEDGATWKKIADFVHEARFCEAPENVSVGKIPYTGEPMDLPEVNAGSAGTSKWDELTVY